jgi:hypothetical protein
MAETVTFRTARMETGQLIIDIPHDQRGSVMHWLKNRKDRDYDLTIKEHRNKRSQDANQKMWALIHEMSTMIKLTPVEIYQGYIPDVGNNYRVFPVKPEDINEFAADWCHGHLGRMVEDMGPCRLRDLRGYHNLRCYKGSSEYDTQTFSRLLELVCQDCKQLGINTLSEREQSLLLEEWEATYADRHQGTVYTKGGQNTGS